MAPRKRSMSPYKPAMSSFPPSSYGCAFPANTIWQGCRRAIAASRSGSSSRRCGRLYPVMRRAKARIGMAGWKAGPPASRMVANQLCLCFGMSGADIVIGQQIGAPEQFGFMRPVGAEAVKQPGERRMRPACRMHTVGDRPDRIAREHAGCRLLMALRHPVDIAAEVEREARHVERIVAAETPESRGIDKITEQTAD